MNPVCLGAFVLRAAMPEMGTDMWLPEMQIFLSPGGLDPTHVLETKLILSYCECAPDGGSKQINLVSCP